MKIVQKLLLLVFMGIMLMSLSYAATLTCQQVSDSSLSVSQFSDTEIEVTCTASGGSVSNIQITPNSNPSTGITITSSQTISSTLSDQSSGTAKWTVTGNSPNTYAVSYTVSSDGTNSWSGASTTQVEVLSPAQLTVDYVSAPSTFSSGDTLDIKISNIGGTTATNVKLQLNSDTKQDYPSSISAGASASYSWTSSTGYDAAATYETKVFIDDSEHDSVSTTVSAASSGGSGGGSGGGGGGGGGGSSSVSTTTTTVDEESDSSSEGTSQFSISSIAVDLTKNDRTLDLNLSENDLLNINIKESEDFTSIEIKAKNSISGKSINLKKSEFSQEGGFVKVGDQEFTIELSEVKVYQVLEIEEDNLDDDIQSATFRFKVDKNWLSENKISENKISLVRYSSDSGKTDVLPTSLIDSDDKYVYYKVVSSGFSIYSIVGHNEKEVESSIVKEVQAEGEIIQTGQTLQKEEKLSSKWLWSLVILILISILIWIRHRRNNY